MSQERIGFLQRNLAYVLLAVVLLSALMLGANRPISWSFLAVSVYLVFGLSLLQSQFSKPSPVLAQALLPAALYLVAIAWGAVQLLPGIPVELAHPYWALVPDAPAHLSADPGQGRHAVMRYLAYGMIFWITLRAAADAEMAVSLLKGIALFSTALALFGLYAFTTGENLLIGDSAVRGVVQASFVNRNSYATYAIFGALANIAVYMELNDGFGGGRSGTMARLRDFLEGFYGGAWIYAFGALVCIGAVTLTQSRAGAMAGLFGLFVFSRLWRRGNRTDWALLAVLAVILLFIAFTSATGTFQRILATGDEEGRFLIYPAVVTGIWDRPLLGHGLGAFHEAFRPYLPEGGATGEWTLAHNSYLENIFEMGLPAALLFYLALGLITWQLWRGARERRNLRILPIFALSAVAAGATHALLDFSLQMPAVAALFAVILGLGYAQSFRRDVLEPKGRRRRRSSRKSNA